MGGEQDGGFQFAGVHVVVVAAVDSCGGAGFGPVFAAGVEPHLDGVVGVVGLLDDVGEYRVSAVAVDDDQPGDVLACQRFDDVSDDRGQRGGADADGAGVGGVFVGAAERDRW